MSGRLAWAMPTLLLLAGSQSGDPVILVALAIGLMLAVSRLSVHSIEVPVVGYSLTAPETSLPPLPGQPGRPGRPLPRAPGLR